MLLLRLYLSSNSRRQLDTSHKQAILQPHINLTIQVSPSKASQPGYLVHHSLVLRLQVSHNNLSRSNLCPRLQTVISLYQCVLAV